MLTHQEKNQEQVSNISLIAIAAGLSLVSIGDLLSLAGTNVQNASTTFTECAHLPDFKNNIGWYAGLSMGSMVFIMLQQCIVVASHIIDTCRNCCNKNQITKPASYKALCGFVVAFFAIFSGLNDFLVMGTLGDFTSMMTTFSTAVLLNIPEAWYRLIVWQVQYSLKPEDNCNRVFQKICSQLKAVPLCKFLGILLESLSSSSNLIIFIILLSLNLISVQDQIFLALSVLSLLIQVTTSLAESNLDTESSNIHRIQLNNGCSRFVYITLATLSFLSFLSCNFINTLAALPTLDINNSSTNNSSTTLEAIENIDCARFEAPFLLILNNLLRIAWNSSLANKIIIMTSLSFYVLYTNKAIQQLRFVAACNKIRMSDKTCSLTSFPGTTVVYKDEDQEHSNQLIVIGGEFGGAVITVPYQQLN